MKTRTALTGGLALAASCAALIAAPGAGATTYNNDTPIVIPSSGIANPYPSSITVSGTAGPITDVNLGFDGITHTEPLDTSFVLVAPSGQAMQVLDCATDSAVGAFVTLDDAAADFIEAAGPLSTGTFKPTSRCGMFRSFPAPGPLTTYAKPGPIAGTATFASTFGGQSAIGTWNLYVIDAKANADSGSIPGGWSLDVAPNVTPPPGATPGTTLTPAPILTPAPTQKCKKKKRKGGGKAAASPARRKRRGSRCDGRHWQAGSLWRFPPSTLIAAPVAGATTYNNDTPIIIPAQGIANPYPSSITVSGMAGPITDVNVGLDGLTHAIVQDVLIVLVAPSGQGLMLQGCVGGNPGTAAGAFLTFDDVAAGQLPDDGGLATGTFKPTNRCASTPPVPRGGASHLRQSRPGSGGNRNLCFDVQRPLRYRHLEALRPRWEGSGKRLHPGRLVPRRPSRCHSASGGHAAHDHTDAHPYAGADEVQEEKEEEQGRFDGRLQEEEKEEIGKCASPLPRPGARYV